ncbi:MAG: peptidylprolyl isomerase [Methylomarinum sp.]|nr:peptidylprolyl isomerase [Methylomarinum sp.]
MLLKIREKSQGLLARIILLLIGVTFALWGIQNYMGGGSEAAIASVGDKEFFQEDLNRAYSQYSQNLSGMDFDEKVIKKQALDKLIQDEVLFQHVQDAGLVVTDEAAKNFIKTLDYFQTDGVFNKGQYHSLLAAQRMSPPEFVARIKKALKMEQFQRSIIESSFATEKDVENFFRIQNQLRDAEVISIALQEVKKQPAAEAIDAYYQQNQNQFVTTEQVAIEYVELSLAELAKQVKSSDEQLKSYYSEQKDLYTTKERRKISHILFAFTKDAGSDDKQLERALNAKKALASKQFSVLAEEVSDDKLTASKGGDLGLFNVGVMEKAFEDAAKSLKLGEVSEPVKSAFGYHLIKVTELVAGEVKSFDAVKEEITVAYQRSEAESSFYELGESLTEISYENPDSLQAVADELGLAIHKTGLFAKTDTASPELEIISAPAVVNAAFSEDVLKGNNSEAIEIGTDKLVVLRMTEHKAAEIKALEEVKETIVALLLSEEAKQIAAELADKVKSEIIAGKSMQAVADENGLKMQKFTGLTRSNGDIAWQVNQEIFKAAKPVDGKSTVITVADLSGSQAVVNLLSVTEGVMTESDKAKKKLAAMNIAKAFGQADFNAALNSLQGGMDIKVNISE